MAFASALGRVLKRTSSTGSIGSLRHVIRKSSAAGTMWFKAMSTSSGGDPPLSFEYPRRPVSERPIYLDSPAATQLDPRVLDAMMPFFTARFGNPHSQFHFYGWEAKDAVELARGQVADLIGSSPTEVSFTSGTVECNNLAVKGVMQAYKEKRHIVTTQTEDESVLCSCRHLETEEGIEVTYLPVGSDGVVDVEELKSSIRPDTGLVSISAVNGEVGVIQPMKEIGAICREFEVPFHTDASHALGKIPIDVEKWNVGLMSLCGDLVYGPKGIGALYHRSQGKAVRIQMQMSGRGEENGIRSGLVPTPLVVGMGAACKLAKQEMDSDGERILALRQRLLNGLLAKLEHVIVHGSSTSCVAGILHVSFVATEGGRVLYCTPQVALFSGTNSMSPTHEPSHVLRALGLDLRTAKASVRFGIGKFTTAEEIDRVVNLIVKSVEKVREYSVLWEMMQDEKDGSTTLFKE